MKNALTRFLATALVCVITLVGYGVWYAKVEAKSSAVARLESQIVIKTNAAARVASTRETLAELADSEVAVQAYFVPETGVVAFINRLEALGRARGANISVLSVSTSVDGVRPLLALSLVAKGGFDAVMRTVGAIEYAPYDITFTTLSVTQEAKGEWRADVALLVGSVPASLVP